jgi:glycosyltransferase involved in cell wall biosynthesis
MHVAYIHQHFSTRRGATGTRSYEMARRLIGAGHRVTMICGAYELSNADTADSTAGAVSESEVDGIRVLRVNEPYANRMGFMRRVKAFVRFSHAAAKLAGRLDADLVFATSTPLTVGLPGMKAAKRLGASFVFEVRDLWPELPIALGVIRNPLLKWYLRRMERRIYFAASHIIALAPGIKEGIAATGFPNERISMIPNSCDLDVFVPGDAPLEDSRFGAADDFRLVFTGAHGPANGLDAVLDAAAELKRRGVKGVRLVFIGDGGQRERLMERSRREGLGELTCWVKSMPKEELARILPRMDVGMMILKNVPAFYYGTSPNKFFDYIASGLPVLNNYPGWLAGLIGEHRCGVAVRPDDAKAFADAVLRLRDDRAALREMGVRGRLLAEAEFSRDVLGGRFVKTLEQVHSSQRRKSC